MRPNRALVWVGEFIPLCVAGILFILAGGNDSALPVVLLIGVCALMNLFALMGLVEKAGKEVGWAAERKWRLVDWVLGYLRGSGTVALALLLVLGVYMLGVLVGSFLKWK